MMTSPPLSVQSRREALASILFAAVSAEAFINELHHLVREWTDRPSAPGWAKTFDDILEDAEKSRTSIKSKYQLAKFILSGQPFDKGAPPFQDFASLVEVRNLIVHARPPVATLRKDATGKFAWAEPPVVVRLQNVKVAEVDYSLIDIASRTAAEAVVVDLVGHISTRTAAQWACTATAGIVNAILDAIPNEFATAAFLYRSDFKCP